MAARLDDAGEIGAIVRVAQCRVFGRAARGFEGGACLAHADEFGLDRGEAGVVGVFAVRGRALALGDDFFDRAFGRGEVGDFEEAGQTEFGAGDLRLVVADEDFVFAPLLGEADQAVQRAVIEVALAGVVLRRGREQIGRAARS